MPDLACCPACNGFVVDIDRACPHCGATPAPRRGLMRYLALRVFGAAATVTLMACYGITSDYDCYPAGTCACTSDYDCPIGMYCDSPGTSYGTCTPSSTCDDDTDCSGAYECDIDRTTCVPDLECTSNADCPYGLYCDDYAGICTLGGDCDLDIGLGCGLGSRCDPEHDVCFPCNSAECGACTGEVTCTAPPPECPEGSTPAIEAGCYTGACRDRVDCALEACSGLDEAACFANSSCEAQYAGINCTDPEGDPCTEGTAMCTCESFEFDACVPAPPPD